MVPHKEGMCGKVESMVSFLEKFMSLRSSEILSEKGLANFFRVLMLLRVLGSVLKTYL